VKTKHEGMSENPGRIGPIDRIQVRLRRPAMHAGVFVAAVEIRRETFILESGLDRANCAVGHQILGGLWPAAASENRRRDAASCIGGALSGRSESSTGRFVATLATGNTVCHWDDPEPFPCRAYSVLRPWA
jgi:hypothetical protein